MSQTFTNKILLAALALSIGFLFTLSTDLVNGNGYFTHTALFLFLQGIIASAIALILLVCSEFSFRQLSKKLTLKNSKTAFSLGPEFKPKSIVVYTLIMLACWSPWLVALYPGSMNWDTYYQITMCFTGDYPVWYIPYAETESLVDNAFSDHHPIFDTLLFGSFAKASETLFGSWNQGVFLYVLLQSVVFAAVLVLFLAYLNEKWGVPRKATFFALVFFSLFPLFPGWASTMIKDSLFAICFVAWLILVAEVVRTKATCLHNLAFLAGFIATCCLVSLTKKTGVYLVIATLICFIFIYRHQWCRLMLSAAIPAGVMFAILPLIVFPLLDVIPGGKQEVLGILFQQTARYVTVYSDEIDTEEQEAIDAALNYDTLAERYNPKSSDPVKFMWNYNATQEELTAYFSTWLSEGMRHPFVYLEATLATIADFFSTTTLDFYWSTADVEHDGTSLLSNPTSLDGLRQTFQNMYRACSNLPLVGLLFSSCTWVLFIPGALIYISIKQRRDLLPFFIPVFLSICILCISPAYSARYALPMVFSCPLFFLLLLSPNQTTTHRNRGEAKRRIRGNSSSVQLKDNASY